MQDTAKSCKRKMHGVDWRFYAHIGKLLFNLLDLHRQIFVNREKVFRRGIMA